MLLYTDHRIVKARAADAPPAGSLRRGRGQGRRCAHWSEGAPHLQAAENVGEGLVEEEAGPGSRWRLGVESDLCF